MEKFERELKIDAETKQDETGEEKEIDIDKEKKAELIQGYVKQELSQPAEGTADYTRRVKQFFSEMNHPDFEKILGEEDFALVSEIIFQREDLKKRITEEIKKAGLLREFTSFTKEKPEMFPLRLCKPLEAISYTGQLLDLFFHYKFSNLEKEKAPEEWPLVWAKFAEKQLEDTKTRLKENGFLLLKGGREEWEKYSNCGYEREKEEKPIKIEGFEKFDLPQIKAKKILETVLEMLPRGNLAENVKIIRYTNENAPDLEEDYGIEGKSSTYYDGEAEEIGFYRVEDEENFLKFLKLNITRKWILFWK